MTLITSLPVRTDAELEGLATVASQWVEDAQAAREAASAKVSQYGRDLLTLARKGEALDDEAANAGLNALLAEVDKAAKELNVATVWSIAVMAEQWTRTQ